MGKIKLILNLSIILLLGGLFGGCVLEQQSGEEQLQYLSGNETETTVLSENEMQDTNTEPEMEHGTYYTMEEAKALDIPEDMLAYWMVLNGKKPFVSYDRGGQEFFWNEFYGIRADEYMIVDMDNDGEKEVVLYACPESTWILHYEDGSVYGYEFPFRRMKGICTNGIYTMSEGASDGSYRRITELNADGYTEETLVEYHYYSHVYKIGGKDASEEEALELIESIRDGSELADEIDGTNTIPLVGSITSEERSILENVQREEIIYPYVSYLMNEEVIKAYYDVLSSQREFVSTEDGGERIYMKNYFPVGGDRPDEDDISSLTWRPDRIWYFSIVDMDGDGTCEVILDGTYARDILSYRNGEVYSYRMNAGTIFNSGIVCEFGYPPEYKRIISFDDNGYVMEAIDYDGDINDDIIRYYYFSEELIEQYFGT